MRRLVLAGIIAAVLAPAHLASQTDAFHLEALGPGILGSINYERVIQRSVSLRVGLGHLPKFDTGDLLLTPMMANVLFGRGEHRLEVGAGAVLVYALNRGPEDDPDLPAVGFREPHATATLAYRLEPGPESSFHGGIYRIGLTPIIYDGEAHAFFGASAGFYVSTVWNALRGSAHRSR